MGADSVPVPVSGTRQSIRCELRVTPFSWSAEGYDEALVSGRASRRESPTPQDGRATGNSEAPASLPDTGNGMAKEQIAMRNSEAPGGLPPG